MSELAAGDLTRLLESWSSGNQSALNEVTPLVYRELRRFAASLFRRERPNHTLQATALVHEVYLRLRDQVTADCRDPGQFFAVAVRLMRQILVNHAVRRRAAKRGGGVSPVRLESVVVQMEHLEVDFLALNEALEKLARLDPRQSQIVELRFFAGLTENEIAQILNIAPITVKREWRMAKAVLQHQLLQRHSRRPAGKEKSFAE